MAAYLCRHGGSVRIAQSIWLCPPAHTAVCHLSCATPAQGRRQGSFGWLTSQLHKQGLVMQ